MAYLGNKFRDAQAPAQSQLGGSTRIPAVFLTRSLGRSVACGLASSQPAGYRASEDTVVGPPGGQVAAGREAGPGLDCALCLPQPPQA